MNDIIGPEDNVGAQYDNRFKTGYKLGTGSSAFETSNFSSYPKQIEQRYKHLQPILKQKEG